MTQLWISIQPWGVLEIWDVFSWWIEFIKNLWSTTLVLSQPVRSFLVCFRLSGLIWESCLVDISQNARGGLRYNFLIFYPNYVTSHFLRFCHRVLEQEKICWILWIPYSYSPHYLSFLLGTGMLFYSSFTFGGDILYVIRAFSFPELNSSLSFLEIKN